MCTPSQSIATCYGKHGVTWDEYKTLSFETKSRWVDIRPRQEDDGTSGCDVDEKELTALTYQEAHQSGKSTHANSLM